MKSVVWLRRDLRLRDNVAIERAVSDSHSVVAAFVVDPSILSSARIGAPIVNAFFAALSALRDELRTLGSDLAVLAGDPITEIPKFARRVGADAVYFNDDYESFARERDRRVMEALARDGVRGYRCVDHVVFGPDEIARPDGMPYKMFTPFARAWLERWQSTPRFPVESLRASRKKWMPRGDIGPTRAVPVAAEFGIAGFDCPDISERAAAQALDAFRARASGYARDRDFPARDATSHLSPHLRAGTIGIRTCVAAALATGSKEWLNELVWREFYQSILANFPRVENHAFLERGDRVKWRASAADLDAWAQGRTGYPIVDAGMRQLNQTGWMHNRLRMITASFLTKHLLIDWREGERIFEKRLMDADMAQNNGGWQWCASTGTDAAPYFRVFNPTLQAKKFDPDGAFVKMMIPELRHLPARLVHEPWKSDCPADYPARIVDHAFARDRAIRAYAAAFRR